MIEKWKVVPGYEKYMISNYGRCISNVRRKKIVMKPHYDKEGYVQYTFYNNGKRKMYRSNRLVCWLFDKLEDIDNLELVACHKDDNPKNNRLDNLFVGTISDNQYDCVKKGRNNPSIGQNHGRSKLKESQVVEIKGLLLKGLSRSKIGNIYNVSSTTITKIALGQRWRHI